MINTLPGIYLCILGHLPIPISRAISQWCNNNNNNKATTNHQIDSQLSSQTL